MTVKEQVRKLLADKGNRQIVRFMGSKWYFIEQDEIEAIFKDAKNPYNRVQQTVRQLPEFNLICVGGSYLVEVK